MHFRIIKTIIRKKLANWIETIDSAELRTLVERNVIVTGGCIASMALNEPVNDYDVYFKTKHAAIEVAAYYASKFREYEPNSRQPEVSTKQTKNLKGVYESRVVFFIGSVGSAEATPYVYEEDRYPAEFIEPSELATETDPEGVPSMLKSSSKHGAYTPVFFSSNAVTLTNDMQIIIRFWGNPAELHENYDFAHCMGSYDYAADHLEIAPETMQCLLERSLVYKGSLYPLCTMMRLRKFLSRGWRINAGEMLKIAANVAQVDFNDPDVLEEQLMGVDASYMLQFIATLRAALRNGQKITPTLFSELLDKAYD